MTQADVVCERTYQVEIDGETHPIPVRWLRPEPDPKGDWSCGYEIGWPGEQPRTQKGYGVDSTQALLHALMCVSAELYTHKPPVFWFEPNDDLGLPVADSIADLRDARSK